MGKKKGRQPQDDSGEDQPAQSSLGDFLDFPSLGGLSAALPEQPPGRDDNDTVVAIAHVAAEPRPASVPPPITPPELTAEELEARHKKEKRELEGAARAARKAAGKNKAKLEEAEAATEQAIEALRVMHERELRGFQLRPEGVDGSEGHGPEEEVEADRPALAGIKDILAGSRSRDAVSLQEEEELRIDSSDGNPYPLASFLEVYGEEEGRRRWDVASAGGRLSGANESRLPYIVMGSKKGGFPVTVEKRARGKTVRARSMLCGA